MCVVHLRLLKVFWLLFTSLSLWVAGAAQAAPGQGGDTECLADVLFYDNVGKVTGKERIDLSNMIETGEPDRDGLHAVWVNLEKRVVGWTNAVRFARGHRTCIERVYRIVAENGSNPCVLYYYRFDKNGNVTETNTFDVRRTETMAGKKTSEATVSALPGEWGLVQLRDASTKGDGWFSKQHALQALRSVAICQRVDAQRPVDPPSQGQPTGSLRLLCELNTGNAYIFVVDEARQVVSARDSTGTEWVTFRNGQRLKQRVGNQTLDMEDAVRVDATSIRLLRTPVEPAATAPPNVSNNQTTNELVGLLGNLLVVTGTSSSVSIDRNSAVIRTGGMGLFPNNASGYCEPWTGRRF